jgi:hypothetical protein
MLQGAFPQDGKRVPQLQQVLLQVTVSRVLPAITGLESFVHRFRFGAAFRSSESVLLARVSDPLEARIVPILSARETTFSAICFECPRHRVALPCGVSSPL